MRPCVPGQDVKDVHVDEPLSADGGLNCLRLPRALHLIGLLCCEQCHCMYTHTLLRCAKQVSVCHASDIQSPGSTQHETAIKLSPMSHPIKKALVDVSGELPPLG